MSVEQADRPISDDFTWEKIIGPEASSSPSPFTLTGKIRRRVERIEKQLRLDPIEGNASARKNIRKVLLSHAQSNISKFAPAALRENFKEVQIFGKGKTEDLLPDRLISSPDDDKTVTDLDVKLKTLLDKALSSSKGERFRTRLNNFPVTEDMSKAQKVHLIRQVKSAILADLTNMKRFKRIKSKAFRKYRRNDAEKESLKLIERLGEIDPEAAENLRQEYETKRAEMRLMKQSQARRKWAKAAARFGGREAQSLINSQLADETERRKLFHALAKKSVAHSDDDESSDEDDDDGSGDEAARYMKKVNDVLEDSYGSQPSGEQLKGIRSMKFMQMGGERRRAELEEEARLFFESLASGKTPAQAALMSRQILKDDLQQDGTELVRCHNKELLSRKRRAEALSLKTLTSEDLKLPEDLAENARELRGILQPGRMNKVARINHRQSEGQNKETAVGESKSNEVPKPPGEKREKPARKARKESQEQEAEYAGEESGEEKAVLEDKKIAEVDDLTILDQNLLVKMAFNIPPDDFCEDDEPEAEEQPPQTTAVDERKAAKVKVDQNMEGWNTWASAGSFRVRTPRDKIAEAPTKKIVQAVKVNEKPLDPKYIPQMVVAYAAGYKTVLADTAVGKEWAGFCGHLALIKPKQRVVAGKVIEAMKFDNDVKRLLVEDKLR